MAGSRSRARALALKYLYYVDLEGASASEFDEFVAAFGAGGADTDYAGALARRALQERIEIDRMIGDAAENWEVGRISAVERNILRIGCVELSEGSDVPPASAIDEAVTLAKAYGDRAAGAFVNGVLDAIRRSLAERDGKG